MYLIHPFLGKCGWAVEGDRDWKENLGMGTNFQKDFYVCSYLTVIMMWEMRMGLWPCSQCYCLLLFCLAFMELLWFQRPSSSVSYSTKEVLGDVIVNCIISKIAFSTYKICFLAPIKNNGTKQILHTGKLKFKNKAISEKSMR